MTQRSNETLHNGIILPDTWPPRDQDPDDGKPMSVPYLESPPRTIPVDVGRQLFVDDFLIERTSMTRTFHKPTKCAVNPILKPETALEMNGTSPPCATPKSGGIWWDPDERCYKMWYEAGWLHTLAYATSANGLEWNRPSLDIEPGTNRILTPDISPDSTSVFLDYAAESPEEKYKMILREPNGVGNFDPSSAVFTSPDGVHWNLRGTSGATHDRSTAFYNPFRKKWVFSLKQTLRGRGRCRKYWEHDSFVHGAAWRENDPVFWVGADSLDLADERVGDAPQLYNLDAVAYESVMVGMFQVHKGPHNRICMKTREPKITELTVGFSRDGFHWTRPVRTPFVAAEREPDAWDRGYVQSVGGICSVVGDHLLFFYTGFKGDPSFGDAEDKRFNGMYGHGATGAAMLRRDGFASMDARGDSATLTTRPLTFSGKHLFVNVNCPNGELKVELLDQEGHPVPGYSMDESLSTSLDSTIHRIKWRGAASLDRVAKTPVRLRFHLTNGSLYAFWVSLDESGASHGYVGAGGPGFTGPTDTVGRPGYGATA